MSVRVRAMLGALGAMAAMAAMAAAGAAEAQGTATFSGARQYARERATADSLRGAILSRASFAGFADAPCSPGDVRTFDGDAGGAVPALLSRLELMVLAHGVGASLETDLGRALLRAVVRLEGGGPGPRWDTDAGDAPRAFNPILPTELFDSESGGCVLTPGDPPDGIVLPDVRGFVVPRDSGAAEFAVAYGSDGVNAVRDHFFSRHLADPDAVLHLTRVTAHAQWEDFAVAAVARTQELRGSVPLPGARTGAVYLFRRHGAEWRLLAVSRAW